MKLLKYLIKIPVGVIAVVFFIPYAIIDAILTILDEISDWADRLDKSHIERN